MFYSFFALQPCCNLWASNVSLPGVEPAPNIGDVALYNASAYVSGHEVRSESILTPRSVGHKVFVGCMAQAAVFSLVR